MISILLPIYNNEETIKEVLNSLINNINKNDEIIIIDDCSNDNSYSIVKSYSKRYQSLNILINLAMALLYSENFGNLLPGVST